MHGTWRSAQGYSGGLSSYAGASIRVWMELRPFHGLNRSITQYSSYDIIYGHAIASNLFFIARGAGGGNLVKWD